MAVEELEQLAAGEADMQDRLKTSLHWALQMGHLPVRVLDVEGAHPTELRRPRPGGTPPGWSAVDLESNPKFDTEFSTTVRNSESTQLGSTSARRDGIRRLSAAPRWRNLGQSLIPELQSSEAKSAYCLLQKEDLDNQGPPANELRRRGS